MTHYKNIWDYKTAAKEKLASESYEYLTGGADDLRTFQRNMQAYQYLQLRPRRLVDVRTVDTTTTLLGKQWKSPIILAPVGMQGMFHPDAELASVKAAHQKGHLMITSSVSTLAYPTIAKATALQPWFQLYTSSSKGTTQHLLNKAKEGGAEVIVLTVDVPVPGNREKHVGLLTANMRAQNTLGNYDGMLADFDASLTWDFIQWLRDNCDMKILLKGIMTAEDAVLCLKHGLDGIIISNHGGRQLESDCSTMEVVEEIVNVIQGKIPILIDGGIRRGTDILKVLALGADAVCIGRAYIYGLAAEGQAGVAGVLDLLQTELERNMQLLGITNLQQLNSNFVRKKLF